MRPLIYDIVLIPEEEGGYTVEIPSLNVVTCGDDVEDAICMATDLAKTVVASLAKDGAKIPEYERVDSISEGAEKVTIAFEPDPSWVIEGPFISAAQAARELNLSRSRITHMLNAGILEGYRQGRNTYITVDSVKRRLATSPKAGRPAKRELGLSVAG